MKQEQWAEDAVGRQWALGAAVLRWPVLAIAALIGGICLTGGPAAAASVIPTRLVLRGHQRSAALTLVNNGTDPERYRISFLHLEMTPSGMIYPVKGESPTERWADALLRYSPHEVTIGPGQQQTIRLEVRKPAGLAGGEYRTALLITELPPATAGALAYERLTRLGKTFSLETGTLFSLAVPVMIEQGNTKASVTLDVHLLRSGRTGEPVALDVGLNRSGSSSILGNLKVSFEPNTGGERPISEDDGLAVYAPLAKRSKIVNVGGLAWGPLKQGRLRVVYAESNADGGKVLAQEELRVP